MGKRMNAAIKKYRAIQENNPIGGGMQHVERQHNRGKLTYNAERPKSRLTPPARCDRILVQPGVRNVPDFN